MRGSYTPPSPITRPTLAGILGAQCNRMGPLSFAVKAGLGEIEQCRTRSPSTSDSPLGGYILRVKDLPTPSCTKTLCRTPTTHEPSVTRRLARPRSLLQRRPDWMPTNTQMGVAVTDQSLRMCFGNGCRVFPRQMGYLICCQVLTMMSSTPLPQDTHF